MSKTEWFKKQEKNGDKQKLYQTVITLAYDYVNKFFDFSRKLMYLEEPLKLAVVVLLIFILAILGQYLSTLWIVFIAFNIYVVLGFGNIRQKISDIFQKTSKTVSDSADKYIPKYQEGADVKDFASGVSNLRSKFNKKY